MAGRPRIGVWGIHILSVVHMGLPNPPTPLQAICKIHMRVEEWQKAAGRYSKDCYKRTPPSWDTQLIFPEESRCLNFFGGCADSAEVQSRDIHSHATLPFLVHSFYTITVEGLTQELSVLHGPFHLLPLVHGLAVNSQIWIILMCDHSPHLWGKLGHTADFRDHSQSWDTWSC